jgi:hypothetical protein
VALRSISAFKVGSERIEAIIFMSFLRRPTDFGAGDEIL